MERLIPEEFRFWRNKGRSFFTKGRGVAQRPNSPIEIENNSLPAIPDYSKTIRHMTSPELVQSIHALNSVRGEYFSLPQNFYSLETAYEKQIAIYSSLQYIKENRMNMTHYQTALAFYEITALANHTFQSDLNGLQANSSMILCTLAEHIVQMTRYAPTPSYAQNMFNTYSCLLKPLEVNAPDVQDIVYEHLDYALTSRGLFRTENWPVRPKNSDIVDIPQYLASRTTR